MSDLDRAVAGRVVADRVETLCISIRVGIGITGSSPRHHTLSQTLFPHSADGARVCSKTRKRGEQRADVSRLLSEACGRPVAASELQKQRLFFLLWGLREREGVVDQRDGGIVEQH